MTPAKQLLGAVLKDGWKVKDYINRPKNGTGGHFSESYIVESDKGERAFLKAMDYHKVMKSEDPAKSIQPLVDAYNFERSILEQCKNKKLSKIIRLVDHGTIHLDETDPFSAVQYIIFELAKGDIRNHIENFNNVNVAWTLRMLHNVAVGLKQLHGADIAHQDIKPSNILVLDKHASKVTDLGRAASKFQNSPFDTLPVAGDRSYAPPELLYEKLSTDWGDRRLGCDIYLLGSLTVFMFTGVNMTSFLLSKLDDAFHWNNWGGSYEEVLPYIENAFSQAIVEIEEVLNESSIEHKDDLIRAIRQLCEPNPAKRGHPKNIMSIGNSYSLERYCSLFDRLAKRAEFKVAI